MTYNVSDDAGNAATEVTRTVNVTDTTAPITLNGDAVVDLSVGDQHIANQELQHQIIMMVIFQLMLLLVVRAVDTSTVGQYTVTYNVSDSSGNAATEVTRTGNVTDTTAPVITLVGDAVVD